MGYVLYKCQLLFYFIFWLLWVFVSAHGLSLVVVCGPLITVASLVGEHRF